MNVTEEHLHHMAKRHHHTMGKLRAIQDKARALTSRFIGTLEVGAGAWLGGVAEGRLKHPDGSGGTVMHVPVNLAAGVALLAAGHLELAGKEWSDHLNNLGNGFVGSYVAAAGYTFGTNWRDTGRLFGHGAAALPPPAPAPAVTGELSEAQMADIVRRMQAAAAPAR